jgi:hypothetical protein
MKLTANVVRWLTKDISDMNEEWLVYYKIIMEAVALGKTACVVYFPEEQFEQLVEMFSKMGFDIVVHKYHHRWDYHSWNPIKYDIPVAIYWDKGKDLDGNVKIYMENPYEKEVK